MGNISAEQHNMTRRAAKQKRKKAAKNQRPLDTESPLRLAIRDREMRERRDKERKEHGSQLLERLDKVGVVRFSIDAYDCDDDELRNFYSGIRAIQEAIKALPHERRKLYKWQYEPGNEATGMKGFSVAKKR